jgi:ribonuclease P/MRP protein subunit POP1
LAQDDRVPLLLIQNTVGNDSSLSSSAESALHMHGWTILTPLGWGMPFLYSLVHSGSRVGGQRELKSQAFESGVPHFPDDFPGTNIGQMHAEEVGSAKKAKWERTPPVKRVSYAKLGTRSPWLPDWEIVCGIPTKEKESGESELVGTQRMDTGVGQSVPVEVSKEPEGTGVWLLRHTDTKDIFGDLINCVSDKACAETLLQWLNAARVHRGLEELKINPELLYKGALVQVTLTMCQRGDPEDMACIYFVGHDECKYWQNVLKKAGQQQYQQV